MDSTLSPLRSRLARIAFAAGAALAALSALSASAANHEVIVQPLAAGPFKVACSNIQQDAALIAQSGVPVTDFWEGKNGRYITEILPQGSSALRIDALVPDIRTLYPGNAGDRVPFVAIVCHPTPANNTDADYVLPGTTTDLVPRMLPPGAQPRLISANEWAETQGVSFSPPLPGVAKLPVIVYSHGLSGSPIGKGYINVMTQLAAHGYMVAAIFHGDARFSRVRLEDFGDYFYALTQFDRVAEMMLMRPVSLKAMTDMLLSHAGYAPGIDAERIGGFGASMGAQAMMNLLGARMTTTIGLACRETVRDTRIKAAVGYVPYSGQTFLPAFCEQQRGAEEVNRPFLAITGSADTTAPEKLTEQAVNLFKGSRYVVSFAGGEHELRAQDVGDLVTWMITFLDAYLQVPFKSQDAQSRLIRMAEVQGGREDSVVVDVHVPTAFNSTLFERPAVEFYNTTLNHYFVAGSQGEVDFILAGNAGPGWILTNESHKIFLDAPPGGPAVNQVCRFYGVPAGGPNSHFFAADAAACEAVKRMPGWAYEGLAFRVVPQLATGKCPAGMLEVRRAYNDRAGMNDSNHRYSTSDSTMREMARRNWAVEGTAWCSLF
jgi:predicted dienelactone hydrolase